MWCEKHCMVGIKGETCSYCDGDDEILKTRDNVQSLQEETQTEIKDQTKES